MGAIIPNVGIVLGILGFVSGFAALIWVYLGFFGGVGIAALFESRKTSSKGVDADHDRNMARQERSGDHFSPSKLRRVHKPSIVEQRTTHQEHH